MVRTLTSPPVVKGGACESFRGSILYSREAAYVLHEGP